MSAPEQTAPTPPQKKKKHLILLAVLGVVTAGAGVMAPRFLASTEPASTPKEASPRVVFLPFGEATVNLAEGQLRRYLRVKIVLSVESPHKSEVTEATAYRKASLRNWMIAHLSDKTLQDVTGRVSVNRIRREIRDHFNEMLLADGAGHIQEVLFEEFVVQ